MGKGVGRGEGDWKVRGGQLIPGNEPEWIGIGIRYHEQDTGLPSKWGVFFLPLTRGFVPKYLIMCYINRKI